MITGYFQNLTRLEAQVITVENSTLIKDALWIDLLAPTDIEEALVEKNFNLEIPTKKEMQEIEPSNRLYKENDSLFMTATMLAKSDSPEPKTDAVTFILTQQKLITVRYIEPNSFSLFISRFSHATVVELHSGNLLIGLLEATVVRLADILEKISHQLDQFSQIIFHPIVGKHHAESMDYQTLLQNIGANGDLGTKAHESLISFNRLIYFFAQSSKTENYKDIQSNIDIITKDIEALTDHTRFISSKVSFLLDATLGMVNIEQNNIIKIFSVAAVIFLPPTLIASIYGMNFSFMPELHWALGYPFSILLMLLSAWLPYRYFKGKKWL